MRARNLKPSLFKNEVLAELPVQARYLFCGLWCMADREGRLEDRPKRIRVEVYPYEPDVDVDSLLNALESAGFITRYSVDGELFIQVENFTKHQYPHVKEQPSTIPAPDKNQTSIGVARLNPPSPIPHTESPILNPKGDVGAVAPPLTYTPEMLRDDWNLATETANLPRCRELTGKRRKAALSRLREHPARDYWLEVIGRIRLSPFCTGANDRSWRADFDFLLRPGTSVSVLEGKYNNTTRSGKSAQNVAAFQAFVNRKETTL